MQVIEKLHGFFFVKLGKSLIEIKESFKFIKFETFLTLCSDGDQFYSFTGNEVQSLVDIGDLVEPHLATIRLLECFSGNDLEQQHQFEAIAEVLFNVFNLRSSFA